MQKKKKRKSDDCPTHASLSLAKHLIFNSIPSRVWLCLWEDVLLFTACSVLLFFKFFWKKQKNNQNNKNNKTNMILLKTNLQMIFLLVFFKLCFLLVFFFYSAWYHWGWIKFYDWKRSEKHWYFMLKVKGINP